ITACTAPDYGATRLRIPAPGTAHPDHNPPRIAPRHLFDIAVGTDNLFHRERVRTTLKFAVMNLTGRVALYNFLSTFSGTHFVAPRTFQAALGFTF
ncbi:MAG TPA: TonB-dependent receptor, partial [Bryobacteraceae bacterium]|nr:TonB-dependent receptor [Bryobacteraceae bacterium]